jgi:hypothetical protein
MDAVTYPSDDVTNFISDKFVPLRVPYDSELASQFGITWTPTIIVLDFYGREHFRSVGFLPPEEFIPAMLLGMAKLDFDANEQNDAVLHLNALLERYPQSAAAPEGVYLRGVSRYKGSHDGGALKEAYETLKSRYPQSEWTRRAQPYSLL